MIYIYKYTNLENSKVYVGQTNNVDERKYQHTYRAFVLKTNYPFYAALRKYSEQGFTFSVLETCEDCVSDEREIYYIEVYDATNRDKGYNLRNGGGRRSLHESTKLKIATALKGNKNGVRANWSEGSLEKRSKRTTEQLLGIPKSEGTKLKIANTLKGRKRTVSAEEKRHKAFMATVAIKEEEIELFKHLVENNADKISIRLFYRQTGINRPRLDKIRKLYEQRKCIKGESGEA